MAQNSERSAETRSEFLRRVLGANPMLDHHRVNLLWKTKGHPGQISRTLFYRVRSSLGIRSAGRPGPARKSRRPGGPPDRSSRLTGEVYQFRVTLQDTHPPVWRRFQVEDCTLNQLHEHIQTAMGWTNSHLHQFQIEGRLYGDPELMQENFAQLNFADSTTTAVSEILPPGRERFRFEYEYDFGDDWQHDVLFEGRLRAEPGSRFPVCVEGERACPPEDVGGPFGYADLLEALADPAHESHDTLQIWLGRPFDPETFDEREATRRMIRGLPVWRR